MGTKSTLQWTNTQTTREKGDTRKEEHGAKRETTQLTLRHRGD